MITCPRIYDEATAPWLREILEPRGLRDVRRPVPLANGRNGCLSKSNVSPDAVYRTLDLVFQRAAAHGAARVTVTAPLRKARGDEPQGEGEWEWEWAWLQGIRPELRAWTPHGKLKSHT
eukprot:scaffold173893_cov24-Tisochrysis_lutea.AAC.5